MNVSNFKIKNHERDVMKFCIFAHNLCFVFLGKILSLKISTVTARVEIPFPCTEMLFCNHSLGNVHCICIIFK